MIAILCATSFSAQAQAPIPNSNEQSQTLESRVADLEEMAQTKSKDSWDKFGVISPLLSGILVALIGFYATNVYNSRQREAETNRKDSELLVAQVQTVEKFLPHLSAQNEESKQAALIAISALGNAQIAIKLAELFRGSGSAGALAKIAQTGLPDVAKAASNALANLFDYLKTTVVTIHNKASRCSSGFVAMENGVIVTAAHAIQGIAPSDIKVGLPDGRIVPAALVASDDELDLAIIRCSADEPLASVALAPSHAQLGTQVVALLVSLDGQLTPRVGRLSGKVADAEVSFGDRDRRVADAIHVDLDVAPGSSGAPVLDDMGQLLGIIQASDLRGKTYLISASAIAEFVHKHGSAA